MASQEHKQYDEIPVIRCRGIVENTQSLKISIVQISVSCNEARYAPGAFFDLKHGRPLRSEGGRIVRVRGRQLGMRGGSV